MALINPVFPGVTSFAFYPRQSGLSPRWRSDVCAYDVFKKIVILSVLRQFFITNARHNAVSGGLLTFAAPEKQKQRIIWDKLMIKGKLALVTCALTLVFTSVAFRRVGHGRRSYPEAYSLALSQRKVLCRAGFTAATYCFMRRCFQAKRRHELG